MSGTGRRSRINPLVAGFIAGVAIALVVGLMATINLQYGAPWAKTYALTAQVTDADSMSVGSDVRIAGRLVGQVTSIQAAGDHANVLFHVDSEDWPLPADTTASVRLATLLGQKYIQLNPGHSSQSLADGGVIGLRSTKPVVDFDQILDGFDQSTRDSLTSLVRTVSSAVQNQEGTLQQLIPDLSNLSVNSNTPTGELVSRNPEINAILINFGIAADQLNKSRDDLAGAIDNLNTVSATLAANGGSALKGYITETDALNITTHEILGGGAAAQLDSGLQKLSNGRNLLLDNLNTLLAHLYPQTVSFSSPPAGREPSEFNKVPSIASIDLIYEIGNATSQGDALGNFFLRQNAQSVDVCGLVPCSAAGTTGAAPAPPGSGAPPPICIPLITCPGPTPPVGPTPPISLPPISTPSLPITLPPLPTPTLPIPTPTLPIPTPCVPLPLLTCPPTLAPNPALTAGVDVTVGDAWHYIGYWPLRFR